MIRRPTRFNDNNKTATLVVTFFSNLLDRHYSGVLKTISDPKMHFSFSKLIAVMNHDFKKWHKRGHRLIEIESCNSLTYFLVNFF